MSPQGERYLPLDSPTSQGPHAFVVNPPARHSACVGRHSPLLTHSPHSHLVPRCRLRRLPPVLLSLRPWPHKSGPRIFISQMYLWKTYLCKCILNCILRTCLPPPAPAYRQFKFNTHESYLKHQTKTGEHAV